MKTNYNQNKTNSNVAMLITTASLLAITSVPVLDQPTAIEPVKNIRYTYGPDYYQTVYNQSASYPAKYDNIINDDEDFDDISLRTFDRTSTESIEIKIGKIENRQAAKPDKGFQVIG
jgi:hypothetical protein